VLWGRLDLLEQLAAYKVRPSKTTPPHKFETGTLNHEGLAGISAAIDYLADVGRNCSNPLNSIAADTRSRYTERRRELKLAMDAIMAYERPLFTDLLTGIQKISGIHIYGIMDAMEFDQRCPTLAFTREGFTPSQIAEHLGNQGIFVWDGNYYALAVTQRLGVEDSGGMVRVGLAHYNTKEEIDRLIAALKNM
jgi:selenocysteine lyase/cysteine desulfurase